MEGFCKCFLVYLQMASLYSNSRVILVLRQLYKQVPVGIGMLSL